MNTPPTSPVVQTRLVDRVLYVQITRPGSLNALSEEVLTDLTRVFTWVNTRAGRHATRVAVISGAGERAFSAGADIAEMAAAHPEDGLRIAQRGQAAMAAVENAPIPVIAAVDGVALGGGCELILACDVVLATEASRFGQPEVHLGLIPCFGGCVRLPATIGRGRARHLILTGEVITAAHATTWGLVSDTYPDLATLNDAVRDLCQQISSHSGHAIARAKTTLNTVGADSSTHAGFAAEQHEFADAFPHPHAQEGMTAFLERRSPHYG